MGLAGHRTRDLGPQALQLVLGNVAAHQFQRTGQHPGLARQRQAFYSLFLAVPVHAEITQLRFDFQRHARIFRIVEKIAHRLRLFFRQGLAHVEPVGIDDPFQRAEFLGQLLCPARPDRGDMQLVDQPAQCGTGGKLGAQFALILQLQAALQQLGNHLLVVAITEEAVNLVRHFQPHIRQVGQHLRQGLLYTLQRGQRTRQHFGSLFSYIRNAQCINKTRQGRTLAVGNGLQQVFARQLGEAFEIDDLLELQGIEVCRRTHQPLVDQLFDALFAQAFNIHCPARDKMNDRLFKLGTTRQPADTAIHRAFADGFATLAALDQLRAFDMGAAHRAVFRNLHRAGIFRAALEHHLNDLRDDIASTANNHGVANHQPQPRHFIHVVQGGIGHGDTRHLDRLETRHRGYRTGAPDLKLHIQQLGQLFHRRKLVGDGPARLPRPKAQLALRRQVVDLEHHAIDFIGQRSPALANVAVVIQALGNTMSQLQFVADRHAPLLQLLEIADMGIREFFRDLPQAVAAEFQRAAGSDLRIQLTQAARRRVTRVGEGLAASGELGFIEPVKTGLGHKHFAAYFQHCGPATAMQLERDIAHGAHIDADVFTGGAITPGGTAHQVAIAVQQTHRQPVQLGFAAVFNFRAATKQVACGQIKPFTDPAIKFTHIGFIKRIAQAQHGHFVTHLSKGGQRRAAYPLGRRVGSDQLGMLGFQRLQLTEQTVVLGVRDARLVEHMVTVVMLIQFSAQL